MSAITENSLASICVIALGSKAKQLNSPTEESLRANATAARLNKELLFEQLNRLPQFTVAVRFDFESARISPVPFRTMGLMADSLYHPYLQGDQSLIVGHSDAKGSREYNLRLSHERVPA